MAAAEQEPQRPMLEYALDYVRGGLPILPVCSPAFGQHRHFDAATQQWKDCPRDRMGKIPMVTWLPYQTRLPTEKEIRGWWRQWPNANIGMATGTFSGVVILDADGTEARKECLRLGGLDQTRAVWTGKVGGAHYHLKHPGYEVRNFARKIPGTDFRGDGGYALLPPSLHASGNRYRWIDESKLLTLADPPTWLLDLMSDAGDEDGEHEALDVELILEGIPEGQRDDMLWRYASKMRAENVPQDYATLLVRQAAARCRPPFTEADAVEKVMRAYKKYGPDPVMDLEQLAPAQSAGKTPTETSATYQIQTLGEMLSQGEERAEQLAEGLLWAHRVTWAFARPGTGKTLFLLALALHIAAGKPFCGRAVRQGAVLMLSEDSPFSVLAEYVEMLCDIYGFDPNTLPFYVNQIQGLRLTEKEGLSTALSAVEACPQHPTVVLMDACERFVPSDRYSTKELQWLDLFFRDLVNRKITPIMIDHTRRPPNQKDQRVNDPFEELYGGITKQAISDVMIHFKGNAQTGLALTFVKFRGRIPEQISAKFASDEGWTLQEQAPRPLTTNEQKVTKWLNHHTGVWHSCAEIAEGAGCSERTARRAVGELVVMEWVEAQGETHTRTYRVNASKGSLFS